ncbi:DUF11 domain-containing protein [Georgenia halophila]|uniref:DUF11 domain-containing protein n=1 Tax=Georgenia halophila TaxID=620889 RepID=UPI0031EAE168
MAAPAAAAPGDPFDPTEARVFVAQDTPTQLKIAVQGEDGNITFQNEGPVADITYNAIAYNPADNYIYAVSGGEVIRVGQDGDVQTTEWAVPPSVIGAFGADGLYYTVAGTAPGGDAYRLTSIDVSDETSDPNTIEITQPTASPDMTYLEGYFWSVGTTAGTADATVTRLDPTTGVVESFPAPGLLPVADATAGAQWTYGNGNIGISDNTTGNVSQIQVTNPASDAPTFTRISTIPGPGSSNNDGTSSLGVPADLALTKTVEPGTAGPGSEVTYTLTVVNNGQGNSSGHIIADDLPEGLENVSSDDPAVQINDDGTITVAGGRLEANQSATYTYTGTLTESTSDVVNTATVTGNEEDPTSENNTSSSTLSPRDLTVEKVSDATEDTGPGDTVGYTVTVSNDGTGDYTVDEPAVVADDLTGVLDDATFNDDVAVDPDTGSVDLADGVLTWSGPLASGDSIEITYSVTVDRSGDHQLVNSAGAVCEAPVTCDPAVSVTTPLPHVVSSKVADPADGEALAAGDVVEYTLRWENEGLAAGPVDSTDDLSGVLDDAELTTGPEVVMDDATAEPVTATLTDENLLRVVGELGAGQGVTVTYQATVRPDGERGDNELGNVLAQDQPVYECDDAGDCGPVPPSTTQHPIGELTDWKSVDPVSGGTVQPGTEVTYTLHFTNTGQAPVEVARDDVLTGVLDDATVVEEPAASDEALSVSEIVDGRIAVTGTLEPEQEATVSYTVAVNPDGERGDDQLGNFLVDAGAEPPTECVPGDEADCTISYVSNLTVDKSADPESGEEVEEGQEVTYSVTFANTSTNAAAADAVVDYTDHLVDVLDDATLSEGPSVEGTGIDAAVEDDTIVITGGIASGETATVTYTVTVNDYDDQGNHSLGNVVAVTGEDPVCVEGSATCTQHPAAEPPATPGDDGADDDGPISELPDTGADVWATGLAAIMLIGAGVALTARRNRTREG